MNLDNFKFTEDQKKFVSEEVKRLLALDSKTATEEMILTLINVIQSGTHTKQQASSFERVMKNEFKKYKARLELEKIKDDEKKLLANLKKEAQALQVKDRKKRDHKLISIGALFEMVDFPTEDKGIITGILLEAIEKSKSNQSYFSSMKISGDKFISDREKSKKEKSTLVDNSEAITNENS